MEEALLLVFCTFPDAASARQIGTVLVETQLAACVNLVPAIESIYRWQGKVESATETLAIFKTTTAAFPAFEQKLTELHPYQVPEIVALAPDRVSGPYREWVLSQLLNNEAKRQSIFPLWSALGTAKALSCDFAAPWESEVPSVMKAWDELTSPSNLDSLVAWHEPSDGMNPFAKQAALRAFETCRMRIANSDEPIADRERSSITGTMKSHPALSVIAPAGELIRSGKKTLEIRQWIPESLPLRDLVIVQNEIRLSRDGVTDDPDGEIMAIVDVESVEEWTEDEIDEACASSWEAGWMAWRLSNVRPLHLDGKFPARLRIYPIDLPE